MAGSRGVFGGCRKTDHAHPSLMAAFCLLAVALTCGWAWPVCAHADEALLPGASDEAGTTVDDDDPTDMGIAPIGGEPNGDELASALDGYLDGNFPASGIPGMAVAVVDSDGMRYLRTLGDVASADDTFIIGSLSKSMTSLAVQQLVDQGLIDLDASACAYAPGYDVPADVTVRDLLNQTSGFGYYESLAAAQMGESYGSFSYANANYDLLGRIVEHVSGEKYADYLHDHVFEAIGMWDASVDGEEGRAPAVTGHRNWFGLSVADGFAHGGGDSAWGGPASGYVRASIEDMASYLRMYLNSGEGVVSRAGVRRMVFDRVPDPAGDTFYGMGWTTYTWGDGELVMSHDGDVENYVARMCVIPGRDLGVVVLADANDAVEGNSAFWQIADDVTSLAVGGQAQGVDGHAVASTHTRYDAAYALALFACLASVALAGRWARRMVAADATERAVRAVWGFFLHVIVPLEVLGVPAGQGMRFCDFADFYPEQALVIVACAGILALGGAVKVVLLARAGRRQQDQGATCR